MAKNKNKVVIVSLISAVVILSIVSVVSIIYNIIGGFYFSRFSEYNNYLGEDLTINVKNTGSYSIGCNFSGTIILNTDVKQKVFVQTNTVNKRLYLRAKMEVSGIDNAGYMFGTTNWVTNEDDYIYLNQSVTSNEKISMCNYIRLYENLNIQSNKNYIIIFTVETSETPWI